MIRNNPVIHGHNYIKSGFVPTLDLTPSLLSGVSADGALEYVAIDVADATQVWSYAIDVAWVSVGGASLLGDDSSVRITVDAQAAGAQPPRTGHVTFSSTYCADKILTINQLARAS
jgi:hypothetical protein